MSKDDITGDAGRASARRAKSKLEVSATSGPGGLAPAPETFAARSFRSLLMRWYRQHARRLPWRGVHDPYATWLSEIMLQQTRVATVIERYGEFLRRFPTLQALAAAKEDDVLALWSGLGYYRRARMLHRGAQFVVRELKGRLPRTVPELRTLPGVGEYTAAAVGSIAFGQSVAVVDGNVERVLLRIYGLAENRSAVGRVKITTLAQSLVPAAVKPQKGLRLVTKSHLDNPPGDHNQAMMELGATVCLPRQPLCLQCPVVSLCRTRGEHPTPPRGRQKSRLAVHLLATRKRGSSTEVLLERRAADTTLMPGMLELPPLPLTAVEKREPVLRVRHSITNTNYVVHVYTESAKHLPPEPAREIEETEQQTLPMNANVALDAAEAEAHRKNEDYAVYEAEPGEAEASTKLRAHSLLAEVPAALDDLEWVAVNLLRDLPLTGLARKCLQRLLLMPADVRHRR